MESARVDVLELKEVISDAENLDLDNYVLEHPGCSLYHLSAWRNSIVAAYQHRQLVLVARHGGVITGYLPLCLVETPLLGKKIVSLPFADYCGALADSAEISNTLLQRAAELLGDYQAKSLQIRSRQFDLHLTNSVTPTQDQLEQLKIRMCVPLADSAEALLKSYKPKLRSQIKKAEKNGLTVQWSDDFAALQAFYQIYCRNMHRLGSPVHSFRWFEALWHQLKAVDAIRIALVRFGEVPVAAGVVITAKHQAWIPWASTLTEFNHLAPNMLMYWHIQANLADKGVKIFDMGRSTAGEGTFRFKAQWGAEAEALYWFDYTKLQLEPVLLTGQSAGPLRKIAEKVWPKLPFSVATTLGARLRKYITL